MSQWTPENHTCSTTWLGTGEDGDSQSVGGNSCRRSSMASAWKAFNTSGCNFVSRKPYLIGSTPPKIAGMPNDPTVSQTPIIFIFASYVPYFCRNAAL